jgi:hypothetical protein
LAAAATLLAACGATSAVSSSSPTASSLVSCTLPVMTWTRNGGSSASQSGFISVPSGAFAPDPISTYAPTYDRIYQRWLPVPAAQVLADGSEYAYENELPDGPYEIHVVWVQNGADKMVLHMPYDNAYSIVAMKPEGIYLVQIIHRSGVPTGLWLFSSTRATLTAVAGAADFSWNVIEGGAAWGGPAGGDTLYRLDLSTGAVTTWFQHAIAPQLGIGSSFGPSVVGFDRSGRPLVAFYPPVGATASPPPEPSPEVWLASSPGEAIRLTGLPLPASFVVQRGVTDAHGTWFVGPDGFYLYTDAGFNRAAPMPSGPVGEFQVAGDCS